jgi:hypothetical protein
LERKKSVYITTTPIIMFFWLKYGNAQKEIFNINCRSLILMDHISKTCLNACQKYVDEQLEIVTNSLADIAVNMEELEKQKQEKEQEGDGGDEEGSNSGGAEETEQIAVDDFDPEKVLEQLKALESLRNLQKSALLEAKEKLDGCLPTDLDLATDDGILKELPALENNSAKAAIEPKSTLNLCRVSEDGKPIFLTFAVPPDNVTVDLNEILGSKRVVRKVEKKPGKHRRNKTEGGATKKGLKDTTNTHRRSQTTMA